MSQLPAWLGTGLTSTSEQLEPGGVEPGGGAAPEDGEGMLLGGDGATRGAFSG